MWELRSCGWEWVPSEGSSGGLISIWKESSLCVEDVYKDPRVFALKLSSIQTGFKWAAANVYGTNDDSVLSFLE